MENRQEVLRLEQIVTERLNTRILSDARLNVFSGETVGIVGVNNAGKTVLAGAIAGFLPCTSGKIYYMEKRVDITSIIQARNLGICYIKRQSSLIEEMSVADNLMLAPEENTAFISSRKKIESEVRDVLGIFGAGDIDIDAEVGTLSEYHRLVVEICKTIFNGARVLILDNVISGISMGIRNEVGKLLMRLKSMDISTILIEPRFRFLEKWCDRLFVLRAGHTVGVLRKGEYDPDKIVSMMTGYPMQDVSTASGQAALPAEKEELFRAENVSTVMGLKDISFSVCKEEILGILCLGKATEEALVWLLTGEAQPSAGGLYLHERPLVLEGMHDAMQKGIVLLPEDNAIIPDVGVRENILVNAYEKTGRAGVLNQAELKYLCTELITNYLADYEDVLESGQAICYDWLFYKKIAFCRGIASFPKLMVLVNPTLHNDFVSKKSFYKDILSLKQQRISGLILSADLEELLALCDRIVIVKNGSVVEEHPVDGEGRALLEYKYNACLRDV